MRTEDRLFDRGIGSVMHVRVFPGVGSFSQRVFQSLKHAHEDSRCIHCPHDCEVAGGFD